MPGRSVSVKELFVLGVVSRQPIHGHGINQIIEISEADRWVELGPKHVYYVLRKLRRAGLISAQEERRGAAPPRTVYTITPEGRETLREWISSSSLSSAFPVSHFDTVFAMLAFGDALSERETIDVLRARRASIVAVLDQHTPSGADVLREQYGATAAHMFRKTRMLLEAELEWIDGVLQEVDTAGWEPFRVRMGTAEPAGESEG
jgi:DNA-binding PadR family transcriptional regulator